MCSLSAVYLDKNALKDLLFLSNSGTNRGDESVGYSVRVGKDYVVTKATRKDGGISSAYNDLVELVSGRKVTMGIAQTRYSTRGTSDKKHAQPFRLKTNHEIVIGHNGTVANSDEFAERHNLNCITESDTEVLGLYLSQAENVCEGIKGIVKDAIGSYNLTVLDEVGVLTVLRDPMGFHPLWQGFGEKGEIYFASEDSALFSLGCYAPRELKPGEMIQLSEDGIETTFFESKNLAKCAFEDFYFKKPGSTGSTNKKRLVQEIRYDLGVMLGEKEDRITSNGIVVPVLESGKFYAAGFAHKTGMDPVEALMRNTGARIYMDPQKRNVYGLKLTRKEKAKLKHIVLPTLVEGKDVFLTEDSIVRGDTSSAITKNLRDAGAREVHWRVAFPTIDWGCIYGLDHSEKKELITSQFKLEKDIANAIGADSIRFLTMDDMPRIFGNMDDYCFACVTGRYPTRVPDECRSAIENVVRSPL